MHARCRRQSISFDLDSPEFDVSRVHEEDDHHYGDDDVFAAIDEDDQGEDNEHRLVQAAEVLGASTPKPKPRQRSRDRCTSSSKARVRESRINLAYYDLLLYVATARHCVPHMRSCAT